MGLVSWGDGWKSTEWSYWQAWCTEAVKWKSSMLVLHRSHRTCPCHTRKTGLFSVSVSVLYRRSCCHQPLQYLRQNSPKDYIVPNTDNNISQEEQEEKKHREEKWGEGENSTLGTLSPDFDFQDGVIAFISGTHFLLEKGWISKLHLFVL